ncbi:hypothetical protein V6N11_074336 [Hibiscus sabdariffa]|uniref:Uncharacterized protein n=1 Tax=Hibiscus sabdariffa TaxID=183260 RepID=A0ABR2R383_9ROSI
MSAIVGVWMDEIEKLKAQAQARGALLWRAKKEQRSAKERRLYLVDAEDTEKGNVNKVPLALCGVKVKEQTSRLW